jgi:hypothetical protein
MTETMTTLRVSRTTRDSINELVREFGGASVDEVVAQLLREHMRRAEDQIWDDIFAESFERNRELMEMFKAAGD